MSKNLTALGRWITKTTPIKVAKMLKVTEMSVYYWRLNRSLPRTDQMLKIKKLSGISTDTMISEFHT